MVLRAFLPVGTVRGTVEEAVTPMRPALMGPPETPATAAALALPEKEANELLALM